MLCIIAQSEFTQEHSFDFEDLDPQRTARKIGKSLARSFERLSLPHDKDPENTDAAELLTSFLETVNANILMQNVKEGDFSMTIDLVDAPKLGTRGVSSKLMKNYVGMLDGGRVYNLEGSHKNRLPLKYILMMTSNVIEEHELSDKSVYALMRRALTGQALELALQSDEAQKPFKVFLKPF